MINALLDVLIRLFLLALSLWVVIAIAALSWSAWEAISR